MPAHVYAGAGDYQVTLRVTDAQGCSATQIYLGQSTTCPGGAAAVAGAKVDTPPRISGLSVKNRRFAVAGAMRKAKASMAVSSKMVKRGTAFRYTLSEAARVQIKIDRKLAGRSVGGKCRRLNAKNRSRKHCTIFHKASPPLIVSGKAGHNATRYTGRRRGGKALAPGRYRAQAVATDRAGGRSEPAFVFFTVVSG